MNLKTIHAATGGKGLTLKPSRRNRSMTHIAATALKKKRRKSRRGTGDVLPRLRL